MITTNRLLRSLPATDGNAGGNLAMAKRPKAPRRHHTVPKFYLRRFAKNNQVRVRSRDLTRSFITSVENASVRSHYYTLDVSDGERSTAVEKMLSEVEGRAAAVMQGLDRGQLPTGAERDAFAFFLALQITRTQSQRNALDEMATAVAQRLLEIAPSDWARETFNEHHGREPNAEELAIERERFRRHAASVSVEHAQNTQIEGMLRVAEGLVEHLAARIWTVMDTGGPRLLTSDSPVLPYSAPSDRDSFWGVGVGNAVFVCYPLDPQRALFMWRPDQIGAPLAAQHSVADALRARQRMTTAEAIGMNRDIAFQAEEWIFEHPDLQHDEIDDLLPALSRVL